MSIIANRYASAEMKNIWTQEAKIIGERRLWLTVMKTQSKFGMEIPSSAISDYEKVIQKIDLESIDKRERELRHDVKARIDEFNSLAGHEYIHIGMTSRDLTENIEAFQILSALKITNFKTLALLSRLGKKIEQYKSLAIVGRTHNVPAQITTLGKRFATIAEELMFAQKRLVSLIEIFPIRGLKGPVGTSQDSLDLMGNNFEILEKSIINALGFEKALDSTGQIYPRSIDYQVITTLVTLSAAPSNMATSMRLMAGHDLVVEGFKDGQVGSSAMPHKMNTRSCERVNGLAVVLDGYAAMMSQISGSQWNEGDVSDSVVRRLALADSFYCIDGLIETSITILDEFWANPVAIEKEIKTYLPFLATTKILLESVKKGMGRESAHALLNEIFIDVSRKMMNGEKVELLRDFEGDLRFGSTLGELEELTSAPLKLSGLAEQQCNLVVNKILEVTGSCPEAEEFIPSPLR